MSYQSAGNPDSLVVPDSYALASMKLLQMKLGVCVQSNQEVELQASLRDVVLRDEQPDQQQKKTGLVGGWVRVIAVQRYRILGTKIPS